MGDSLHERLKRDSSYQIPAVRRSYDYGRVIGTLKFPSLGPSFLPKFTRPLSSREVGSGNETRAAQTQGIASTSNTKTMSHYSSVAGSGACSPRNILEFRPENDSGAICSAFSVSLS